MRKIWINGRFLTQPVTGVQRYSIELVRAMDILLGSMALPYEFELILPQNAVLKHELKLKNITVRYIGFFSGHIWEQLSLPILFAFGGGRGLLLSLGNIGPLAIRRQVLVIHDVSYLNNPKWFSFKFYAFYRSVVPLLAKMCRKIITDSNFSKTEISRFIANTEEKILVVYPGWFSCESGNRVYSEDMEYGRYVLAVSSIDPRKNFKRLLLAFKKSNIKNLNLVIVGGENRVFADPELKALSENDSRIFFTGYVPDDKLKILYRNAIAFAYPSLYEGFGFPPLEAMSCGCPVLTSNAASLPEVCGSAAYYVDPYSVDSISAGLSSLVSDNSMREQYINAGYLNLNRFSWNGAAQKILEVVVSELK